MPHQYPAQQNIEHPHYHRPRRAAASERSTVMTKILLALVALAALATEASAQSRQYYDASGKTVGRSATDSQGTVTNYDASGKVIGRETTTGDTTTIYDARGRNVGRHTTSPAR